MVITSSSCTRTLKLRGVRWLDWGHTADIWHRQALHPGLPCPQYTHASVLLPQAHFPFTKMRRGLETSPRAPWPNPEVGVTIVINSSHPALLWVSCYAGAFCTSTQLILTTLKGFPGGASGKEPACQCSRHKRRRSSSWGGKIPWRREWLPTPVFLPGESHGQRSLMGCSPRGHKELDMTKWLTLSSKNTRQEYGVREMEGLAIH